MKIWLKCQILTIKGPPGYQVTLQCKLVRQRSPRFFDHHSNCILGQFWAGFQKKIFYPDTFNFDDQFLGLKIRILAIFEAKNGQNTRILTIFEVKNDQNTRILTIFEVKNDQNTRNLTIFEVKNDQNTRILTCLLYTSPSPRDQRGSRMPSSA